jgi:hypothetical protein
MPPVASDVEAAWTQFAAYIDGGDDWISQGLRPLVDLARADPILSHFFPFQSLNRLCFGPEKDKPDRALPCIAVDRSGLLVILDRTYPADFDSHEGATELGETSSPEAALAILKRQLPTRRRTHGPRSLAWASCSGMKPERGRSAS